MNEREKICVDALLLYLTRKTHSNWCISVDDLDTQYPDRRTPEALISDGIRSFAVEVKGLLGPQIETDFFGDLRNLGRRLAPSIPGHWAIAPPFDKGPRWDKPFIKVLKAEIERVTTSLNPSVDKGLLKISRRALLVMAAKTGAQVTCHHGRPEILRNLTEYGGSVTGIHLLIDHDGCVAVESEEGRTKLALSMSEAAARSEATNANAWVEWEDEWPIFRLDGGSASVEVVASLGAFSVPASVDTTVYKAITDGAAKFHDRWAEHHILMLDSQFAFGDVVRVGQSVAELRRTFGAEPFGNIDEIVLYADNQVTTIYPVALSGDAH